LSQFKIKEYASKYASGVLSERIKVYSSNSNEACIHSYIVSFCPATFTHLVTTVSLFSLQARSLGIAVQQWLDVLNASPRQGMSLCLSVKTADYPEPAQLELLGGSTVAECIGKAMLEMQCSLSLFDNVQLEFGGVALPLDSTLEQNDIETDARLSLTMNGNDQIQALFSLATTVLSWTLPFQPVLCSCVPIHKLYGIM
jgi:hypothetical protein